MLVATGVAANSYRINRGRGGVDESDHFASALSPVQFLNLDGARKQLKTGSHYCTDDDFEWCDLRLPRSVRPQPIVREK